MPERKPYFPCFLSVKVHALSNLLVGQCITLAMDVATLWLLSHLYLLLHFLTTNHEKYTVFVDTCLAAFGACLR